MKKQKSFLKIIGISIACFLFLGFSYANAQNTNQNQSTNVHGTIQNNNDANRINQNNNTTQEIRQDSARRAAPNPVIQNNPATHTNPPTGNDPNNPGMVNYPNNQNNQRNPQNEMKPVNPTINTQPVPPTNTQQVSPAQKIRGNPDAPAQDTRARKNTNVIAPIEDDTNKVIYDKEKALDAAKEHSTYIKLANDTTNTKNGSRIKSASEAQRDSIKAARKDLKK